MENNLEGKSEKLLLNIKPRLYNCFLISYCGGRLISVTFTRARIFNKLISISYSGNDAVLFDECGYPLNMEDLYNLFLDRLENYFNKLDNDNCVIYKELYKYYDSINTLEDFVEKLLSINEEFNLNPGDCIAVSKLLVSPLKPIGYLRSYDYREKIRKYFEFYLNKFSPITDTADRKTNVDSLDKDSSIFDEK